MLTKQPTRKNCRRTSQTERIATAVRAAMPAADVDAYRYNSVEIRIRVISKRFAGKSLFQRDRLVMPVLESLDDKARQNLLILFTFTPSEIAAGKFLNYEYEHPEPAPW